MDRWFEMPLGRVCVSAASAPAKSKIISASVVVIESSYLVPISVYFGGCTWRCGVGESLGGLRAATINRRSSWEVGKDNIHGRGKEMIVSLPHLGRFEYDNVGIGN